MTDARPFTVMTKPNGPRCNIDCKYCYYLEKERLYPEEKKFQMSDEVLETYVRDLISAGIKAKQNVVSFMWQGGEPTILGRSFFERAVALQKQYAPAGMRIDNSMQTNGMLLDDGWGEFLSREKFLLGVSVDGPKRIHDRYRRDRADRPTFDAVMAGVETLKRHNVEYNILTTLHRANVGKGKELYRFLRGLGTAHLQFIPIVERKGLGDLLAGAPQMDNAPENIVTDWSVSPRAYGKFLCDVFDIWYRQDIGKVFIQFFENQIALWHHRPASLCIFAETCGQGLAMEHNGDVYACDHYVYPQYKLGNIMETPIVDLGNSQTARQFGNEKRDNLTAQCQSCKFRHACNGGCPKHRILMSKDGEPGHNYFCESYTMFFKHAGDRLKQLAAW